MISSSLDKKSTKAITKKRPDLAKPDEYAKTSLSSA
jgi:hypothetical protein